jgi:hypothetical protein
MHNFGECPKGEVVCRFHLLDLLRCRSELHTSRGRKRKVRIFEASRGFDMPLTMPLKKPLIPLPIPPQIFTALQSRLERLCSRGAGPRRP